MRISTITTWRPRFFLVFSSLFCSLILMLLPLPGKLIWLRPMWLMLVLVYWLAMFPRQFNLGLVWITGIALDILYGSLLGEHAFALTLSMYFFIKIRIRFIFSPFLQQMISIFIVCFVYQLIIFCCDKVLVNSSFNKLYWLSSVVTMLVWPWIFNILQYWQARSPYAKE